MRWPSRSIASRSTRGARRSVTATPRRYLRATISYAPCAPRTARLRWNQGRRREATHSTSRGAQAVLLSEARKFEDALPLLMEAFEGYRSQRGLTHPSTISLVVNVSQVLFVVPLLTEGLDSEQSRERGIAITREVLDACSSAASGGTDRSEGDRAAHGRQAKMLAAHLVKLLKAIGRTEEVEKVVAEFGL